METKRPEVWTRSETILAGVYLLFLASLPWIPIVLIALGYSWLRIFVFAPQIIWAILSVVSKIFKVQKGILIFFSVAASIPSGVMVYALVREFYIDFYNVQQAGSALDLFLVAFVYGPALVVEFFLIFLLRRPLGLSPLFERDGPPLEYND